MRARVLAAILVTALACEGKPARHGRRASPTQTVEVVPVREEQLDAPLVVPAQLFAFQAVDLRARTEGFVESIDVDRGSRVSAGEILVRLSAPELEARRAAAAARLRGQSATATRLRAAARTPGAVAGNTVEVARAEEQATRAEVSSAAALEQYLIVRAPFDGLITARFVHPGALVGPSSERPLVRLEELDHLRLVVYVPEYAAGAVREGGEVPFRTDAFPGQTFTSRVARVAHSLDPATRTMPVEADVDNRDGRLAPGMYADVDWHVHRASPSLLVPARAVVQTTSEVFVLAVRGGVVHRVPVERGMTQGDALEVFGRLGAGELVVARGREDLAEGARVETRPARSHASAPERRTASR